MPTGMPRLDLKTVFGVRYFSKLKFCEKPPLRVVPFSQDLQEQ